MSRAELVCPSSGVPITRTRPDRHGPHGSTGTARCRAIGPETGALGADGYECTVAVMKPEEQEAKIAAFSVYASQVAATEKGDERAVSDPSHVRLEAYMSLPGVLGAS